MSLGEFQRVWGSTLGLLIPLTVSSETTKQWNKTRIAEKKGYGQTVSRSFVMFLSEKHGAFLQASTMKAMKFTREVHVSPGFVWLV